MLSVQTILFQKYLFVYFQGLRPRPGPDQNRCRGVERDDYFVTHYGKAPASGVNLGSRLKVDLDIDFL
jgi:hypothetical protein